MNKQEKRTDHYPANRTIRCYRCGTEFAIPEKNNEILHCPHCQGKMQLSKETKKRKNIILYIIYFLVSFIALFIYSAIRAGTRNPFDSTFIVFIAVTFFATYFLAGKIVDHLAWSKGWLEYVHVWDKSDEKAKRKGGR